MTERTGSCQCGAVAYKITVDPDMVVVCHCKDCQKQSGSAFGLVMVVDEAGFELTRGSVKTFHGKAASGRDKMGAFCPDCGCRIYHKNESRPGKLGLRAGTLDDTSGLQPVAHIWTKDKQPWVVIPEGVKTAEGQPG